MGVVLLLEADKVAAIEAFVAAHELDSWVGEARQERYCSGSVGL